MGLFESTEFMMLVLKIITKIYILHAFFYLFFFTMCCMEEGRGAVMLLLARVKRSQSDREVHQLPPLIHPPLRPALTHQVKHGHESERKGQSEWCVHRMCVCV